MSARTIIGIAGKAGTGKSTVSFYLQSQYGFKRMAFADPVKGMLTVFLSSLGLGHTRIKQMLDGDLKEVPCEELDGRSPRQALQTLGTEWGRERISLRLWTMHLIKRINELPPSVDRIVVDDVRMSNEAAALIMSYDATIWGIETGGLAERHPPLHSSETGIPKDMIDTYITHDFTMDRMTWSVDVEMHKLRLAKRGPWK